MGGCRHGGRRGQPRAGHVPVAFRMVLGAGHPRLGAAAGERRPSLEAGSPRKKIPSDVSPLFTKFFSRAPRWVFVSTVTEHLAPQEVVRPPPPCHRQHNLCIALHWHSTYGWPAVAAAGAPPATRLCAQRGATAVAASVARADKSRSNRRLRIRPSCVFFSRLRR